MIAGALLISTSAPVIVVSRASSSSAALWRCAFGALLLRILLVALRKESPKLSPREWSIVALGSIAFGTNLILWSESIRRVGAGVATVLGNTQILFVSFLASLVLREHLRRRSLVGLGCIGAGSIIVGRYRSGAGGGEIGRGIMFGLVSAALYGVFLVCFRLIVRDRPERTLWIWYRTSAVAALVCCVASLFMGSYSVPSTTSYMWLFCLALVSQVIGWSLITSGITAVPAARSSAILLIQPVGTILLGWALFGDSVGVGEGIGILSILVGVRIAQS